MPTAAGPDKNTAYSLLAAVVGLIVAAAITGIGLAATEPGEFDLLEGWPLAFFIVAALGAALLAWILLGIFTPLWDVPDLPKQGPSYTYRLRTLSTRRRSVREAKRKKRTAIVRRLPGELKWNRLAVQLALIQRKVWEDERHRVYSLNHDFGPAMSGANGPVRDFLSRCQDADQALRGAEQLSWMPGYGEPLSPDDESQLADALRAIEAAEALAGEALRFVDQEDRELQGS